MGQGKPSTLTPLTDATFDQAVLANPKLVLIDFWAAWCPPCLALTPTLEAVLASKAAVVEGFQLDVDQNPDVPARFSVRGMPTVILLRAGKEVARLVGQKSKAAYEAAIAAHSS